MKKEDTAAKTTADVQPEENAKIDRIGKDSEPEKPPPKKKRRSRKEQIADLEKQVAELQEKALRQRAEFDNYRKRMQRELSDMRALAKISTLEEILPVMDHFQMAMTAADQGSDIETLRQGMNMILQEFERSFENLGVTRIQTAHTAFDPNLHEAVKTEPSSDVEEGIIISEFKAGYRCGDRLLRPPMVIVSSGPADEDGEDDDNAETN